MTHDGLFGITKGEINRNGSSTRTTKCWVQKARVTGSCKRDGALVVGIYRLSKRMNPEKGPLLILLRSHVGPARL